MKCAMCLYRPFLSNVEDALTIISGIAVCDNHMEYVVDIDRKFNLAMEAARQDENEKV